MYRQTRPQEHLKHFKGLLQADAFAGYSKLYRDGRIQEVACWARAHRQIYELHERRPNAITEEALRRIGTIYAVEEQIRGKPPDERLRARQTQALPLLDELKR
ncbi:IS66 family transposase [Trinickia violacea]|uniref:IS66 family transposase n=1 Tax=Trinickia violacea TaxID=2571746 RepID=UPI003F5CE21E